MILAAALFLLTGADLPENVPVPEARPETATLNDSKQAEPKKDDTKITEPSQTQPADKTEPADKVKPADKVEPTEKVEEYVPPPIETEDPTELKACLSQLQALGVVYKESPRIDDGNGCGIDHPVVVTSIANTISLKPEGTMRCKTALQLTRWTTEIVIPMLKTARPDATLVGLDQASTYICRKRNNAETGKISEHAHGNAVDIAGFRMKGGDNFTIKPRMQDSTMDGALQRAITTAACLYFTTVLDPGSDKAHETHLHLDVIKRKNDFRYCW